jgi:excisionase family DNA binding protein
MVVMDMVKPGIGKRSEQLLSTMLTVGKVADILNVHASTIRRWSDNKIIRSYRIGPHGERMFLREDVAIFYLDRAISRYSKEIA